MATARGSTRSLEDMLNTMARDIRALQSQRSTTIGRYTLLVNDSGQLVARDSATGTDYVLVTPEA